MRAYIDSTLEQLGIELIVANMQYRITNKSEYLDNMRMIQNLIDDLCKAKAQEINDSIESIDFKVI